MCLFFLLVLTFTPLATPCPLLDAIKERVDGFGDMFIKTTTTEPPPKPLFIYKKLGGPPTLLRSPDLKDETGQLHALANQVSHIMRDHLGPDAGKNMKLATEQLGGNLRYELGPELLSKPFRDNDPLFEKTSIPVADQ